MKEKNKREKNEKKNKGVGVIRQTPYHWDKSSWLVINVLMKINKTLQLKKTIGSTTTL